MQKADVKTTLNLNNFEDFVTPYTLGLVLGNLKSCPIRIGDIIISTISDNPSTYYAGTQWTLFGQGRTLVGIDTSQSEFNTLLKTGGEKTHKLTIDEMPSHSHGIYGALTGETKAVTNFGNDWAVGTSHSWTIETSSTGGDQSHNNLQPYICVYMWKRTA